MNSVNGPFNNSQPPFSPSFDQNASNSPFGHQLAGSSINPNNLDLFQYQSDGNALSQSPSLSQTPFQVPPVVPAKRGRPSEDASASPRPPHAGGTPRSQTPQQFNQYAGQPGAQQFQTPTPYQQMQHVGSTQASPSPGPPNQMNSPRAFQGQPDAMAHFGQLQNQMNRMGTPQGNAQQSMMRGMNPSPAQNPSMDSNNMNSPFGNAPNASNMNPQDAMRRQYQAQLARSQQQLQNAQQAGQQNPMLGQRAGQWPANMNGQQAGRPAMPSGAGQPMGDGSDKPEVAFMKSLKNFLEQRSRPFNPNPRICGQPISYYRLFMHYNRISPPSNPQGWQALAAAMGFSPENSNAIQELKQTFESELKEFFVVYWKAMQHRRQRQGQGPGQIPQLPIQGSPTQRNEGLPPGSSGIPFPQTPAASSPALPRNQNPLSAPIRPNATPQNSTGDLPASLNGHRKSGSLFSGLGTPDPAPQDALQPNKQSNISGIPETLSKPSDSSEFNSQYEPRRRALTKYGGLDIDAFAETGSRLRDLKTFPTYEELGLVDLHVLNMCLLSGFHAETKYALDRLCALSQAPMRLWDCEDLFDSIIECGETQLRQLLPPDASHKESVTLPNFGVVSELGTAEIESLAYEAGFGDPEYEVEHALDRLLAVTTVLRNLSFPWPDNAGNEREQEANLKVLTGIKVRSLITGCIKCLDCQSGIDMRTTRNTQDLMKDLITILSNIADGVELSSEAEGRLMLDLMLTFLPLPSTSPNDERLELVMYNPTKHQYLPCAVDSLAKLLARDDPNRGFYRSIFNADAHTQGISSSELLIIQAFGLALSPIPDTVGGTFSLNAASHIAGQRRPFLAQGVLAADILTTLVPAPAILGYEIDGCTSLERLLLCSKDGWSSRLLRVTMVMATADAGNTHLTRDRTTGHVNESRPFAAVTQRALSMLRRLVERADRAEAEKHGGKPESIGRELFATGPIDSVLFQAMSMPSFDQETMKQLTALGNLSR